MGLKAFADARGITLRHVPRSAPWYAGWYERQNAEITTALAITMESGVTKDFKEALRAIALHVNMMPYSNSMLSPFEVFRGRSVRKFLSSSLGDKVVDPLPPDEIMSDAQGWIIHSDRLIMEEFERVWRDLRQRSRLVMQGKGKRPGVPGGGRPRVGDSVYVWIPTRWKESKLSPRWEGPLKITGIVSDVLYRVGDESETGRLEHLYNLKLCIGEEAAPPDPPVPPEPPVPRPKRQRDLVPNVD